MSGRLYVVGSRLKGDGEGAPEPSPTGGNLIVFLVAFKAMKAAKTFMSQGNWSERDAGGAGLWPDQLSGMASLTHCEDFA
jgi:hypothetical protein